MFTRNIFSRWSDGEWHYLGEYKIENWGGLNFIPCDDGRFIVIFGSSDLVNNNGLDRSPFARASFPEGKTELRIGASIDHGQDNLRKYMADPKCFCLPCYSNIIMTDSHATILNYETGLYWIFSLEKATLVKAGNIFSKVTPEMAAKGGFSQAVLCARPEKEGTVLVSALEESFFTTETKSPAEIMNEKMEEIRRSGEEFTVEKSNEMSAMYQRLLVERAKANPHIDWYRIHPNGKVEKLGTPPVGGFLVRDGEKNLNEVWRPLPDGSISMGHIREAFPSRENKSAENTGQKGEGEAKGAEPPPDKTEAKTAEPPPKTNADTKK